MSIDMTSWCFICQEDARACHCPRNAPVDIEQSYHALKAIHELVGGCGLQHDAVWSFRSCLMAEIPRIKKKLFKATQAAEQQGRGVQKLRKKLEEARMHGTPQTQNPPAASLAP